MSLTLLSVLAEVATGVTISGSGTEPPSVPSTPMECAAFKSNADGSWTSIRTTRVGSVTLSGGGTFAKGVQLNGVDVGGQLNSQCASKPTEKKKN
jgi:hypothetical protein